MDAKRFSATAVVLLVSAGVVIGFLLREAPPLAPEILNAEESAEAGRAERALRDLEDFSTAFRLVAKAVTPSVVHITSYKKLELPADAGAIDPHLRELFGDEFLRRFARRGYSSREGYTIMGLGSGFAVDSEGHILTNHHVVAGADLLSVTFGGDEELEAKLVGTDDKTEIAVLKVDARAIPVAKLGDSDSVQVGDWVVAIGTPFGLDRTVTAGIVSATGRRGLGITDYEDFLQTDASINPGNSGGPLVNLKGEVIGINTAISSRTGENQGVGFAIPINMAKVIMKKLIEKGEVIRGWLGVQIADLTKLGASQMGLDSPKGAYVAAVIPGTPAAEGGLKKGDFVIGYQGKEVQDTVGLRNMVAETAPGTVAKMKVLRDKKPVELSMKIGKLGEQRP